MRGDWQAWTALGIVAITAILYVRHLLRRKTGGKSGGGGGCDSDCDCDRKDD